jgi:HEAT repeat protein
MAEPDLTKLIARLGLPDPAGREAQEALYALGAPAQPGLAGALRSSDLGTARRAAVVLGWMGTPQTRVLLLDALREGLARAELRAVLVRAACDDAGPGDIGTLFDRLVQLAGDGDYFVRAAVCDGLAHLGDARAEPVLRRAASDAEGFVRDAALKALAALPLPAGSATPGKGAPAVGAAARSAAADRPAAAASPASQQPPPDPAARLRAARTAGERADALEALLARGSDAEPSLELLCDDVRPPTRLTAVRGLLALRDRRALARLVVLVESDPDGDVRGLAARALADIARAEDAAAHGASFLRWTHDPDGWVRAAGVALVGTAPPSDAPALARIVALLADPFEPVAEAAARACLARVRAVGATSWPDAMRGAIGRLADESRARTASDDLLVALLDLCAAVCARGAPEVPLAAHAARLFLSGATPVRGAAVRLLGASGAAADPELAASLVALLDDPVAETRRAALQALAAGGAPPLGSAGLERVARFLHEIDPGMVEPAVAILAQLGSLAAARLLCEAARAPGPAARLAADALAAWPAGTDVAVTRDAAGAPVVAPILRCGRCRGTMTWAPAARPATPAAPTATPPPDAAPPLDAAAPREELRCAACGTLHALGARDRVVPVADAPLGVCACATCARPHLLVSGPGGLSCPISAEGYVMVSDTRVVVAVRTLQYGVCACCAAAQPLEREVAPSGAPRIICHRTRTEHVPDPSGRYAPVSPPATLDGSAIDRALLAGSLRVGRSGVAAPTPPAGEDDL